MGKGNSYVDEIRSIVKILMYILEMGMLLVSIYTGQNQSEKEEPVFQISEAQQCIWGEWKITEMNYAGAGWQECSDDYVMNNASIQLFPNQIIFNGQAAKVTNYTNSFYAIYDELSVYHWITYLESGFQGTYYIELYVNYPDLDQEECPFGCFGLLSEKKNDTTFRAVSVQSGEGRGSGGGGRKATRAQLFSWRMLWNMGGRKKCRGT